MEDVLGKIFAIIIGMIALFYIPITIIAVKQDTTSQNYIDNAVTEFVDNARTTGKVTGDEFEKMAKKVFDAHSPCHIALYHGASFVTPNDTGDGITYHTEYYSEADILPIILDESNPRDYELKDGDYFKVIVYNETPTLGSRLLGATLLSYTDEKALFTSYGGYVGNNMEGIYETH